MADSSTPQTVTLWDRRRRLGLWGSGVAALVTGGGAQVLGLGFGPALGLATLAGLADAALWVTLWARRDARDATREADKARLHADAVEARDLHFFSRLSHEFRTPLTLILAGFRALSEERETPAAVRREVAAAGLRNTARLLLVLHELSAQARLDPADRAPHKRVIDLSALVRRVAGNFAASGAGRAVDLVGLETPVVVEVDPHQIQTVLYALLSHAFHRTDPVHGSIRLSLDATPDRVTLTLRDNGSASVPEEKLEATVTDRGGPGLGLAVVRELVAAHGGEVRTEAGTDGLTLTLTLPREPCKEAPVAFSDESAEVLEFLDRLAHPGPTAGEAPPSAPPRAETEPTTLNPALPLVMVLAANEDLRGWLRRVLGARYAVATGPDTEAALNRARELRPALLLVDADPREDGRPSLVAAIRRDPTLCATPLIGLTAHPGSRTEVDPEGLSADDYLGLPFDDDELLARVASQVRARVQSAEITTLHRRLDAKITEQLRELVRTGELRKYLPQALVEGALRRRPLEARPLERRWVTVLFAELHGFNGLVERMEADDLGRLLADFQREVASEAACAGGVVDQASGDGITVLFGGLEHQPPAEQALAALKTALILRDRVRALAERWHRHGLPHALDARVGVHTGTGLLGVFGSELTARFTVVGPTVHVAHRLCATAQPGEILTSLSTYANVRAEVNVRGHAPLPADGSSRATEVWSVVGMVAPKPPTATTPEPPDPAP